MARTIGSGNPDYLSIKDGRWIYVRRVPEIFRAFDKRTFARASTGILVSEDPKGLRAARSAAKINADTEEYWRGLADGQAKEAKKRYEAARRRARVLGFDYVTSDEVAGRPLSEIMARLSALQTTQHRPPIVDVAGVLGGEKAPQIQVEDLFSEFEKTQKTYLSNMSEDQVRRWRNPKILALKSLTEITGNKPLLELTRNDAIDFRECLQDRVEAGQIQIGTANKQIGHINKMMRTVINHFRLDIQSPFGELRLEGERTEQRHPFDPEFVQKNILADGALDGLNASARSILYLIVETGLRLSEAANLTENTIHLEGKVPYVEVVPEERLLKQDHTTRTIPLVGVSLMAMQEFKRGFSRYHDNAGSLSATVNKFLLENDLRPNPRKHTAYSLRHTFEDRLTAVEAPEKIIAMLMGHKFQRPKYGHGPTLEHKREWLQRIAFTPPSRV
ncbi:tyrosine-type recombinase/integrase [Pseudovibrio denitrificans]|uniref:tyrosine-type recombinase/integrase n=1 Tax=Pseudovibrio denitrificans TaxID=258256 RepID=UPI0039BF93F9